MDNPDEMDIVVNSVPLIILVLRAECEMLIQTAD